MDDKYAREVGLGILAQPGIFDPNLHRVIEGIATTSIRNKNGDVLDPAGAVFSLPVPLLLSHNWLRPIGWVTSAKASPAGLKFTAQVANYKLAWVEEIWNGLKARGIPAVSVSATNARPHADSFFLWNWEELSVCESGANREAIITCVKEVHKPGVLWIDGLKRETVFVRPKMSRSAPLRRDAVYL